jgi:membrane peptidoglycan carboxypeptidase
MFRMDDNESNKNRTFLEMYGTGGQKKIHGASFPAEIWHDYMEQALEGQPAKSFPTPEPIGTVVNDTPSPSVTPTPTQSVTRSPTPSATPSPSLTSSSPSPSDTCGFWRNSPCNGNGGGGTGPGGTDAGDTGGVTSSPTESTGSGNTRGNGNGGIFAGPNG